MSQARQLLSHPKNSVKSSDVLRQCRDMSRFSLESDCSSSVERERLEAAEQDRKTSWYSKIAFRTMALNLWVSTLLGVK